MNTVHVGEALYPTGLIYNLKLTHIMNRATLFICKLLGIEFQAFTVINDRVLRKNKIPLRQLFSLILVLFFIQSNSNLQAQCMDPIPTPAVIEGTGTNPDTLDVNSNGMVDEGDGPIIDLSEATCGSTISTSAIQAGGLYGFILDQHTNYTFMICPTGDTDIGGADLDLFDASAAPWASVYDSSNGAVDATTGCTSIRYSGCATEVILVPYTHCQANWDDYELTITCSTCSITAVSHVGAEANTDDCMSGNVAVPFPTVNPDPTDANSNCFNMVNYSLCNEDGTPVMPAVSGTVMVNDPMGVLTLNNIPLGSYTLKWEALSPCDGITVVATDETDITIDIVMACNDQINLQLINDEKCWVTITPAMILQAPCPDNSDFEIRINGVLTNTICTVGTHTVSITYLPTGASCWGEAMVEDKTGPFCNLDADQRFYSTECGATDPRAAADIIDCTGVANSNCTDETIGNCGVGFDVTDPGMGLGDIEITLPNGDIVTLPDASDAAADFRAYADAVVPGVDPCDAIPAFTLDHAIRRTCTATDVNGMTSNDICEQYWFLWRPTADAIFVPRNPMNLECGTITLSSSGSIVESLEDIDPAFAPHYYNPLYDAANDATITNDFNYIAIDDNGNRDTHPSYDPTMDTSTANDLSGTRVDDNGNAEVLALTANHAACNYTVTRGADMDLGDACGMNVKVKRTWTIFDCCANVIIDGRTDPATCDVVSFDEYCQVIITEDNLRPVFTSCPDADPNNDGSEADAEAGSNIATAITLNTTGTSQHQCNYNSLLPAQMVTDACSNAIVVSAVVTNALTNVVLTMVADISTQSVQLPFGTYEVVYTATDECANTETCSIFYTIADDDSPVAICNEFTVISLNNSTSALICPDNLDNGSYDNCGIVSRAVGRMDAAGMTTFNADANGCMQVTCTDGTIMAVLRVTDAAGNSNTCMVEVEVQDKLAPRIVCPPNVTIECTQDFADHTITGDVEVNAQSTINPLNGFAFDNCDAVTVDHVDVPDLDMCGVGTVMRTWTVTDVAGTTATCIQTITIQDNSAAFSEADLVIPMPLDVTISCTGFENTNPPTSATGEVTVSTAATCKMILAADPPFTDMRFTGTNGDDKIVRTWSFIEWCSGVELEVEQEIWLTGCGFRPGICAEALRQEVFSLDENGATQTTVTVAEIYNGVQTNVRMSTDGVFANASNSITYDCSHISKPNLPPYTDDNPQTVFLHFLDSSNQELEVCSTEIRIVDTTNPTYTCQNIQRDVTIGNTLTVTAEEFIAGSLGGITENCTANANVALSFEFINPPANITATGRITSYTFDSNDSGNYQVMVFAEDESTNVGDTNCTIDIGLGIRSVFGLIKNEEGTKLDDVEVELQGGMELMKSISTDGLYELEGQGGFDYTVMPNKDIDPLNGVTTFDIVLLNKHVLGITPLSTPYKLIAADANNDGTITTYDGVILRQLILYQISDFPSNTSWRFVDAGYEFPQPANPWAEAFPETYDISNLSEDMEIDFVGVKVGDLDCSAETNSLFATTEERSDVAPTTFTVKDQLLKAGEEHSITINTTELAKLEGLQFTLDFDKDKLSFVGLDLAENTVLNTSNIGLNFVDEGFITASWVNNGQDTERLVKLIFYADKETQISDALHISSRYVLAEAYTEDGNLTEPVLDFGKCLTNSLQ